MSARTMNLLTALCVALALLAITWGALPRLAQHPKFQLKRVDVRGDLRHVTAASVRAALAGRLRGNYFTMRLEDTRRMFETVPWVAHASVRRVWPDRLVVTVTEHRALGVWEDGRLLSDRGELFVANPDEAEIYGQLPEFSGPFSAAKDAARQYYELSAQFAALSLRIGAIDISDRKAWSLRLAPDLSDDTKRAGEIRVELGRDGTVMPLGERVAQVIAAYPLVVAQLGSPPLRIDARYAGGLAVSTSANATTKPDRARQ
ncbi:MAG: cell division protein FtsQ/DivIB [Burkholderiaceae bacterium]